MCFAMIFNWFCEHFGTGATLFIIVHYVLFFMVWMDEMPGGRKR
jgi:hypothetical protein